MRKTLKIFTILPWLFLPQSLGFGQSQDFMPLAVGNRWRYAYDAYYDEEQEEWRITETGIAAIEIVGRSTTPDSILWEFEETRDILHRYNYYFPPVVDTTYGIQDTIRYSVIEYLDDNHRFYRKGTRSWNSVFLLTLDFSDSNAFFRFQPQVAEDTLSIRALSLPASPMRSEVLQVVFRRDVGPISVSYRQPQDVIGVLRKTDHILQDASVTSVARHEGPPSPDRISLLQNYPNPFNPNTTITYELPRSSAVRLSVFDMLGREVSVLVNEKRDTGVHEVKFNGTNLASGVYFYRLQAGNFVQARKLLLLR